MDLLIFYKIETFNEFFCRIYLYNMRNHCAIQKMQSKEIPSIAFYLGLFILLLLFSSKLLTGLSLLKFLDERAFKRQVKHLQMLQTQT